MKSPNSSNTRNWKDDLGKAHQFALQKMDKVKHKIERIVERVDSVELLSHISLVTQFAPEGQLESSQFLQDLREKPTLHFLTGLCLRVGRHTDILPTNQQVGKVLEQLNRYFIFYSQGLVLQSVKKEQVPDVDGVILSSRLHKIIGAINRGMYEYQLHDLLANTFGRLDNFFIKEVGFTIADAITFGRKIANRYTRLVNERINTAREAQEKAKTDLNDPIKGAAMRKFLAEKESKEDDFLKSYLGYLVFTFTQELFVFTIDNFCREEKIEDTTKFAKYLTALSCKFGEGNKNFNSPLDDNLIFIKPIINFDDDKYFTPLIQDARAFNLPLVFEEFLEKEKFGQTRIWQKYKDIKSQYIEDKTYEYLVRLFPETNIFRNLHYSKDGQDYEIDCMITYDNKIFLIECKGGAFSEASKRGGVLSLERDLKELVEKAFEQSRRAMDYIKSTQKAIFTDATGKIVLKIKYKPNQLDFIIINITLENLMSLASVPKNLQSLGLFQDNEYPWSVNLFELDHVTEHIPSPTIFIHYLESRLVAQRENIFFATDELSFLAWYLKNGNFYPPKPDGKTPNIILLDASWIADFDDHYLYGKEAPELEIEPKLLEIIGIIEKLQPKGYSNVTSTLLNFDHQARGLILKNMEELIEKTKLDAKPHDFTVLYRDYLDTGFTFMTQCGRSGFAEKLYSYSAMKKYRTKTKRWIGMGRDVLDNGYLINDIIWLDFAWEYDASIEDLIKKHYPFIKGDEQLS